MLCLESIVHKNHSPYALSEIRTTRRLAHVEPSKFQVQTLDTLSTPKSRTIGQESTEPYKLLFDDCWPNRRDHQTICLSSQSQDVGNLYLL